METMCIVTINPSINATDRKLLLNMFAKLDIDHAPSRIAGNSIGMTVSGDDWSALCVLEDLDVLEVSQC